MTRVLLVIALIVTLSLVGGGLVLLKWLKTQETPTLLPPLPPIKMIPPPLNTENKVVEVAEGETSKVVGETTPQIQKQTPTHDVGVDPVTEFPDMESIPMFTPRKSLEK
jgi:hypothetical protein